MADDAPNADPVFGLTARFRSGLNRNEVDVVWSDEVLRLVECAAGHPAGARGGVGRLIHFGFLDGEGLITKAGRAFLRTNALVILGVVTRAVLSVG